MSNPFSHFEHGIAKPIDGCQCCLCRVAFPNTHGAADFFWDHHASEIVDPTDNSGCFHSCLQLGIFLGLVLLLVVSPLFIPRWFRKNKENRNSAFSFLSVAHVMHIVSPFRFERMSISVRFSLKKCQNGVIFYCKSVNPMLLFH